MPRLLGSVGKETENIEVSEETFEKITEYAKAMGEKRFYCTSKIFSHLTKEKKPINERSVRQYLEERMNAEV